MKIIKTKIITEENNTNPMYVSLPCKKEEIITILDEMSLTEIVSVVRLSWGDQSQWLEVFETGNMHTIIDPIIIELLNIEYKKTQRNKKLERLIDEI